VYRSTQFRVIIVTDPETNRRRQHTRLPPIHTGPITLHCADKPWGCNVASLCLAGVRRRGEGADGGAVSNRSRRNPLSDCTRCGYVACGLVSSGHSRGCIPLSCPWPGNAGCGCVSAARLAQVFCLLVLATADRPIGKPSEVCTSELHLKHCTNIRNRLRVVFFQRRIIL